MNYYVQNIEELGLNGIKFAWIIGTHGMGAVLELPIQPIYLKNGPNWRCRLADSSKTAPRILFFSIVLGAEYSFYVKSIATYAPQKVGIIYF